MEITNRKPAVLHAPRNNSTNRNSRPKQSFSEMLKMEGSQQNNLSESSNQAVKNDIVASNAYNALRDKILGGLPEGASTDGGNTLTDEQISDLKERYDITNMSPQEEFAFYKELLEAGAISLDDFIKAQTAKFAVPAGQSYYVREGMPVYDMEYNTRNLIDRLQAVIDNEWDNYYLLRSTHKEDRQDIKEYAEDHERLLGFLKQFLRD